MGILSQQYADGLEGAERGKESRKFLFGAAGQMVFHFLKWENWGSNMFVGRVRSHEGSNLTIDPIVHLSGDVEQAIGLHESHGQGRSWTGEKHVGVIAAEKVFKGNGR